MHLTPDWGMFWIAVLTFVFTGAGAFFGVVWRIAKHDEQWEKKFKAILDEHKTESEKQSKDWIKSVGDLIESYKEETEAKITRQYERFDDFKKGLEGSHVRKELCDAVHKSSAMELVSVNKKLDSLEVKFDVLKDFIMKNSLKG